MQEDKKQTDYYDGSPCGTNQVNMEENKKQVRWYKSRVVGALTLLVIVLVGIYFFKRI